MLFFRTKERDGRDRREAITAATSSSFFLFEEAGEYKGTYEIQTSGHSTTLERDLSSVLSLSRQGVIQSVPAPITLAHDPTEVVYRPLRPLQTPQPLLPSWSVQHPSCTMPPARDEPSEAISLRRENSASGGRKAANHQQAPVLHTDTNTAKTTAP